MTWASGSLLAGVLCAYASAQTDHRARQSWPIKLGTSGGNATHCLTTGTGTLGSLVRIGNADYILSNNHVLAQQNRAAIGDAVIQPGWDDQDAKDVIFGCLFGLGVPPSDIVATLSQFVPLLFQGQNQNNWVPEFESAPPAGRVSAAVAFDSTRKQTVLFGGSGELVVALNDTWTWDGSNWTEQHPKSSPPIRTDSSMVYDSATGKMILFGGWNGNTALNDTWTWDGSNWTQLHPATSPPATFYHSMAYDAVRNQIVLFGGFPLNNATWTWNGVNWTHASTVTTPPAPRDRHAMAFDPARKQTVLFGGFGAAGVLSDTWTWDGSNWTQRTPANSPPGRQFHGLINDPQLGGVVLFGGDTGCCTGEVFLNDTWTWDGTNWTQLHPATSPSARSQHATTYDSSRNQMVVFGGEGSAFLNDTWILGPFNSVDAAIAAVVPNAVDPSGTILEVGPISSTPVVAVPGLLVKKSGRTTGLTTNGTIRAIDVDIQVTYDSGVATFVNQIAISSNDSSCFELKGDSGSLLLEDVTTNPRPVALVFAGPGSTCSGSSVYFANPIQDVLAVFPGSGFVGLAGASLTASTNSPGEAPELRRVKNVRAHYHDILSSVAGVIGTGVGLSDGLPSELVIHAYVIHNSDEIQHVIPSVLDGVRVQIIEVGHVAPL